MTELSSEIVNLIYRASCCKDTPEEAANEPCACAAAYIVEQIELWASERELTTTKQESETNVTEKIKPELDIPAGYELAYAKPRMIDLELDEYYLNADWQVRPAAPKTIYNRESFILRKVKPVWQWPQWLMGEFLVRNNSEDVLIYKNRPEMMNKSWMSGTLWMARVDHIIDIEWPKYDRWQDSMVAKSDCETVE